MDDTLIVFVYSVVVQGVEDMDYDTSETKPMFQSLLSQSVIGFFFLMFAGWIITVPLGLAEIYVLNYLLGTFEPHLLIPVHDLTSSFLQSVSSPSSTIEVLIVFYFSAFLGSLTVSYFTGWNRISDKDIWWNKLSKEEKEKIHTYWMSLYRDTLSRSH